MYFSDPEGNKIDPAELGIEHEAIEGAYDVTLFEDLGKRPDEDSPTLEMNPWRAQRTAGNSEGWNEILEKVAAVVAELVQAK